jgi:hypothetical protein
MAGPQVWKSSRFTIERNQGKTPRTGVTPRVLQLLEMTKVDEFFPRVATVEEAERIR